MWICVYLEESFCFPQNKFSDCFDDLIGLKEFSRDYAKIFFLLFHDKLTEFYRFCPWYHDYQLKIEANNNIRDRDKPERALSSAIAPC